MFAGSEAKAMRRGHLSAEAHERIDRARFCKTHLGTIRIWLRILSGENWKLSALELEWMGYEPKQWFDKKAPQAKEFSGTAVEQLARLINVLVEEEQHKNTLRTDQAISPSGQ